MNPQSRVRALLARARIVVEPEPLVRVHLPHGEEKAVQRRAGRFHAPFLFTFDAEGVWVVCREAEWAHAGRGLRADRVERGYRMITLEVAPQSEAVELLPAVTDVLARSGIPVYPLPTLYRDRLLVPEPHLEQALRVLEDLVASCREDPTS